MSGHEGPTVSRRRLGLLLARYRAQAGVTIDEVAESLECSTSKIRRIETGRVGITRPELMLMLDRYEVTDTETRDKLGEMARSSRQRGWWSAYNRHLSQSDSMLYGLEAEANRIRIWSPNVIPDLLQTIDYARAVVDGEGYAPEEAHRQTEILASRQTLAWDESAREILLVLDESVLLRNIVDPELMQAQLERLLEPPPGWQLGIVPFGTSNHPATSNAFMLLDFPEDIHDSVAYERTVGGSIVVDLQDRVRRYGTIMDRLAAAALPPDDSHALIRRRLEELSG